MIKITDNLWIGDSDDGYLKGDIEFDCVLNVARDLIAQCGHPTVEYAQIGLLDGPGNEIKDYCAVVLTLASVLKRHEKVLVYDHNGDRALVVVMMYLTLTTGHIRPTPTSWSRWMRWDEVLTLVRTLSEGIDIPYLDEPEESHKKVYNVFPFGVVEVLL